MQLREDRRRRGPLKQTNQCNSIVFEFNKAIAASARRLQLSLTYNSWGKPQGDLSAFSPPVSFFFRLFLWSLRFGERLLEASS